MEVLSVLAPLFTQVRHAIDKLDSRLEKATVEGPTWTLTGTDQNAANAELLNLHQQLSAKREELAANVCSAGFVLAEPLWRQLQELEASFSDVCDRPVTNRRVEQLSNLKAATESFINASRNEVLSANN